MSLLAVELIENFFNRRAGEKEAQNGLSCRVLSERDKGGEHMSTTDFDEVLEHYYRALGEFVKG